MQITVDLPDDLVQHNNPGREALEALAIEGYRSKKLSRSQAARLLQLSESAFLICLNDSLSREEDLKVANGSKIDDTRGAIGRALLSANLAGADLQITRSKETGRKIDL